MAVKKTQALILSVDKLQLALEVDCKVAENLLRQNQARYLDMEKLTQQIEKALLLALDCNRVEQVEASELAMKNFVHPQALVVNSSRTVTRMLDMRLSDYGLAVEFAESAAKAITLLEVNSYDIVFLSGMLADTEGYIVCKAIKETPSRRHIPVIIITSKPSQFDKVKAALAGCDAYLAHPVSDDVFQKTLGQYLDLKAL